MCILHSPCRFFLTSQACLHSPAPTCRPSGGQVLSLCSDLAAALISSSHTCVSVSVLTSLQPLRYTQRHALCDPAHTEQTTLFISARSPPCSSPSAASPISQEADSRSRSSGGKLNEPLLTMMENHNKSLITGSNSPVEWCRTVWLVDLELIPFRWDGTEGNPRTSQEQSEGEQREDLSRRI